MPDPVNFQERGTLTLTQLRDHFGPNTDDIKGSGLHTLYKGKTGAWSGLRQLFGQPANRTLQKRAAAKRLLGQAIEKEYGREFKERIFEHLKIDDSGVKVSSKLMDQIAREAENPARYVAKRFKSLGGDVKAGNQLMRELIGIRVGSDGLHKPAPTLPHPKLAADFMDYAKSQFVDNEVRFMQKAAAFRAAPPGPKQIALYNEIMKDLIDPNSGTAINIDFAERQKLMTLHHQSAPVTADRFDEAMRQSWRLLSANNHGKVYAQSRQQISDEATRRLDRENKQVVANLRKQGLLGPANRPTGNNVVQAPGFAPRPDQPGLGLGNSERMDRIGPSEVEEPEPEPMQRADSVPHSGPRKIFERGSPDIRRVEPGRDYENRGDRFKDDGDGHSVEGRQVETIGGYDIDEGMPKTKGGVALPGPQTPGRNREQSVDVDPLSVEGQEVITIGGHDEIDEGVPETGGNIVRPEPPTPGRLREDSVEVEKMETIGGDANPVDQNKLRRQIRQQNEIQARRYLENHFKAGPLLEQAKKELGGPENTWLQDRKFTPGELQGLKNKIAEAFALKPRVVTYDYDKIALQVMKDYIELPPDIETIE